MYWKYCDGNHKIQFKFVRSENEKFGKIKTVGLDENLCWSVGNLEKARKQTVFLKRCFEGDVKQNWIMEEGQIWLHRTGDDMPVHCVPFKGEDQKLETKKCFRQFAGYSVNGRYDETDNYHIHGPM